MMPYPRPSERTRRLQDLVDRINRSDRLKRWHRICYEIDIALLCSMNADDDRAYEEQRHDPL